MTRSEQLEQIDARERELLQHLRELLPEPDCRSILDELERLADEREDLLGLVAPPAELGGRT
jgi:hypothetical protein